MPKDNIFQFMIKQGVIPIAKYWNTWKYPHAHVPDLAALQAESQKTTEWAMSSIAAPLASPELKAEKVNHLGTLLEQLTELIKSTPEDQALAVSKWFDQVFEKLNAHISTAKTAVDRSRASHNKKQSEGDLCLKVLQDLVEWIEHGDAASTSHPSPVAIRHIFEIVLSYQYSKGEDYSTDIALQTDFMQLVTLLMEVVLQLQINDIRFNTLGDQQLLDTPPIDLIIELLKKIDQINRVNKQRTTLHERSEDFKTITESLIYACDKITSSQEVGFLRASYDHLSDAVSFVGRMAAPVTPEVISSPVAAVSSTLSAVLPGRQTGNRFIEDFRAELVKRLDVAEISKLQYLNKIEEEGAIASSSQMVPGYQAHKKGNTPKKPEPNTREDEAMAALGVSASSLRKNRG